MIIPPVQLNFSLYLEVYGTFRRDIRVYFCLSIVEVPGARWGDVHVYLLSGDCVQADHHVM